MARRQELRDQIHSASQRALPGSSGDPQNFFSMASMAQKTLVINWLVETGTMEFGLTFHILGIIIIPTDEVIFFRGVGQPPTRL